MSRTLSKDWQAKRQKLMAELSLVKGRKVSEQEAHALLIERETKKVMTKPYKRPQVRPSDGNERKEGKGPMEDCMAPVRQNKRIIGSAYRIRRREEKDPNTVIDRHLQRNGLPTQKVLDSMIEYADPHPKWGSAFDRPVQTPAYSVNKLDTLPRYATALASERCLRLYRPLREATDLLREAKTEGDPQRNRYDESSLRAE